MKRVGAVAAAGALTALTMALSACGGGSGDASSSASATPTASTEASSSPSASASASDSRSATASGTSTAPSSGPASQPPTSSGSGSASPVAPTPSSTTPATPAFIKAVAQGMYDQARSTSAYSMTRKQSRCVAEGLVRSFGTDRLVEWGVSQSGSAPSVAQLKLTDAEAGSYFDSLSSCGVVTRDKFIATTLAELGKDGADPALRACLESVVDEATLRSLMVDQFLERGPEAPSVVRFQKELLACAS